VLCAGRGTFGSGQDAYNPLRSGNMRVKKKATFEAVLMNRGPRTELLFYGGLSTGGAKGASLAVIESKRAKGRRVLCVIYDSSGQEAALPQTETSCPRRIVVSVSGVAWKRASKKFLCIEGRPQGESRGPILVVGPRCR